MTKQFAMIVGWVLILVGILNFFLHPKNYDPTPVHAVIHIVAGLLAVIMPKSHRGYTLWVGIIGVLLAVAGFAGLEEITKYVNLPSGFNYIHAVLGVAGLLVYFGSRGNKAMPPANTGMGMPPSGMGTPPPTPPGNPM